MFWQKNNILIFVIFLCLLNLFAQDVSSQIIVDHRAVSEFEQIPDEWIDRAKEMAIHYGHTSHGSQILAGLYWIEEYIDPLKYRISVGNRNDTRTPLRFHSKNPCIFYSD